MSFYPSLAQSLPVRVIRHATEIAVAVLVAGYAAVICLQVFYRYVLNDSLVWSEELVRYGLLWGVMLGAALASDRNAQVALEPLRSVLGERAYFVVQWIAGLMIILFCLVTAWYGWDYADRLSTMSSPASQIPMPYVFSSIPIGCLLISFFVIVHLISGSHRHRADPEKSLHS
ncbi:TRAP transporter small permease [Roseisalinus antarcticus]|uniref:TRAP transporter small permease protein n=1 Tax=Roseisalinus antarcticus TaxID=254357 RepID=A0A1Y5TL51_9RHOB|nr:TRAP transporter small permease [Roseisalinus antarcticus]SLN64641.1 2,3-diketo-L-gulonate TRAP transporter small permease protein YiaM [Roseisalinus antarcticus]